MIRSRLTSTFRSSVFSPSVLPGLVAAVCSLGIWALGGWERIEDSSYNSLFKLRHKIEALPHNGWDDRIAVIAIDNKSLREYGPFPWSRDRYASLLETLSPAQPAVVGFDVLFVEPSAWDEDFAEAIAISGNVTLAVGGDSKGQGLALSPTIETQADGSFLVGHVNNLADSDGISRQVQLYEGEYPALSLATVIMYDAILASTLIAPGESSELPSALASDDSVLSRMIEDLPRSPSSAQDAPREDMPPEPFWINWPGPIQRGKKRAEEQEGARNRLNVYSFADVIDRTIDSSVFRNKIVLVGVTATGMDPLRIPLNYEPPTSGVYLHAALIDNLLNDQFLQRPPQWLAVLLLFGLSVGTSLVLSKQKLIGRLLLSFLIPVSWFSIGFLCFLGNWWIPIAAPIGTVLLTVLGVQWQEQLEKQQMMNLFSMHVAPEMAQLIWSRRDELLDDGQLQPQELTATILFMDIRDFTSISEHMASDDLIRWLNRYFEGMTDCIMQHGGVVDKYIGDAIMAVFGIPFPRNSDDEIQADAIAAVTASIEMIQRVEALNRELVATGQPPINIGIGIHTGIVTAGSVGNRRRVNYSVFGDTVNTAARLEAMTKTLPENVPYRILMSEATFSKVYKRYIGKTFGLMKLKGRESQAMTYTLSQKL